MRLTFPSIIILAWIHFPAHAQNFDEWFRQKKTQIKYLNQQIAALQVYIGFIEKGYSIANDGLTLISDIKKGDLDLHGHYFTSLKKVNPQLKKETVVARFIALASAVHRMTTKLIDLPVTTPPEQKYSSAVLSNLLLHCRRCEEDFINLVTDNVLSMKDDERLRRMDQLFNQMQEIYGFTREFGRTHKVLQLQRGNETRDLHSIDALYH